MKLRALLLAAGVLAVAVLATVNVPAPERADAPRSSRWRAVRAEHLRQHPTCAACGRSDHLEVHHVEPFARCPEKECDPSNLITLCDGAGHSCHYSIGHLLSWRSYNPDVRRDAAAFLKKVKARPPPQ